MNLAVAMAALAIEMGTAQRGRHPIFRLQARRFKGGACILDDFDREGVDTCVKK